MSDLLAIKDYWIEQDTRNPNLPEAVVVTRSQSLMRFAVENGVQILL